MVDPLIVVLIKKHQPLNFNITINNPQDKLDEKVAAWLNQYGYKFKKDSEGRPSDDEKGIHIASFKVTKCIKTPNIDEVISYLEAETRNVFVIDTAFNKQIQVIQIPSGRIFAVVK